MMGLDYVRAGTGKKEGPDVKVLPGYVKKRWFL